MFVVKQEISLTRQFRSNEENMNNFENYVYQNMRNIDKFLQSKSFHQTFPHYTLDEFLSQIIKPNV